MSYTKNTIQWPEAANRRATALLIALGCVAAALAGCTRSQQQQRVLTNTSGDLTVTLTTDPWPPHSGDDTAIVTVMSGSQPVNDASVVVTANMTAPNLQGSPASGRFRGNGQYEAPLRIVATKYNVDVHVERVGRSAVDVTFPLEAWQ